jgi:hypothetical protein
MDAIDKPAEAPADVFLYSTQASAIYNPSMRAPR